MNNGRSMSIELKSGRAEGSKEFWRSVYIHAVIGNKVSSITSSISTAKWAAEVADRAVEHAIKRGAVRND